MRSGFAPSPAAHRPHSHPHSEPLGPRDKLPTADRLKKPTPGPSGVQGPPWPLPPRGASAADSLSFLLAPKPPPLPSPGPQLSFFQPCPSLVTFVLFPLRCPQKTGSAGEREPISVLLGWAEYRGHLGQVNFVKTAASPWKDRPTGSRRAQRHPHIWAPTAAPPVPAPKTLMCPMQTGLLESPFCQWRN